MAGPSSIAPVNVQAWLLLPTVSVIGPLPAVLLKTRPGPFSPFSATLKPFMSRPV